MNIYVFSDLDAATSCFPALKKNDQLAISFFPSVQYKKMLKSLTADTVIYLDVSSFPPKESLKNVLSLLAKGMTVGVIDPENAVIDPAELFVIGLSDYIGKDLFSKGITSKRLLSIHQKKAAEAKTAKPSPLQNYILSRSWNEVKKGKEYTFCFMFIELEKGHEIKTSHFGEGQNKKPADLFKKYVEQQLAAELQIQLVVKPLHAFQDCQRLFLQVLVVVKADRIPPH